MASRSRRMGGREGRRAERSAVVSGQQRPVQPGQSGGRYQPLNPSEMEGIHRAVLDALQQIGIGGATPSCRERVCEAGGSVDAEGRLLFPRALVEDPDGIGHVVDIGTLIGKNWGKVTQIKPEEIVITEEYRDPIENELIINEITMRLPDPAEGNKKD